MSRLQKARKDVLLPNPTDFSPASYKMGAGENAAFDLVKVPRDYVQALFRAVAVAYGFTEEAAANSIAEIQTVGEPRFDAASGYHHEKFDCAVIQVRHKKAEEVQA